MLRAGVGTREGQSPPSFASCCPITQRKEASASPSESQQMPCSFLCLYCVITHLPFLLCADCLRVFNNCLVFVLCRQERSSGTVKDGKFLQISGPTHSTVPRVYCLIIISFCLMLWILEPHVTFYGSNAWVPRRLGLGVNGHLQSPIAHCVRSLSVKRLRSGEWFITQ